jgi:hypothetical protein
MPFTLSQEESAHPLSPIVLTVPSYKNSIFLIDKVTRFGIVTVGLFVPTSYGALPTIQTSSGVFLVSLKPKVLMDLEGKGKATYNLKSI